MAASPTALSTSPKTDGGNALTALLAAAAASMHRQQATMEQSISATNPKAATTAANISTKKTTTITGTTNNQLKAKTNQKSSTPSSSAASTSSSATAPSVDKENSNQAVELLMNLINKSMTSPPSTSVLNGTNQTKQQPTKKQSSSTASTTSSSSAHANNFPVQLRNLETWHDEDEQPLDESYYQELVDPSNSNGWSADEMFKYNEKMHKITSSYNERTLSGNYTTPLLKTNSKTQVRIATQLAKEIQDRVIAEGRVTPESSDDDELFETERMNRIKLKQQRQMEHMKNLQRQQRFVEQSNFGEGPMILNNIKTKTTKSSSQYSQNSTETPATISLSSSPTLNDMIKPVTSSSRNILRTCLT